MKRIYVEITNQCNLQCAFCIKNKRPKSFMELSFFESILQQVKPITPFLYLHVQGEPLMHPQFDEILSLCDQNDLHIQLVTNGSFITKDYPSLSHKSLRKISISLQSFDYQTIPNLLNRIEEIMYFVQKAAEQSIIVELRFWGDEAHFQNNTKQFHTYLKEHYPFEATNRNHNYKIMNNVFVDYANEFEWPTIAKENNQKGTCLGTIQQLAILVDGTVVPCCLDADGEIPLGNLHTESLQQIMQSERYQAIYKGFHDNRLVEPLCQKCSYRNKFNH